MTRQDGFKPLLAFEEGQSPQVLAILKHEVEGAKLELRLFAERVLQELKMRDAVLVEHHELAVDHGIPADPFERPGNLDVVRTDDLTVAAVERDLADLDLRDHAEAVVLVLEDPILVVEWRVRQRGEHGLEALRQSRGPAHI